MEFDKALIAGKLRRWEKYVDTFRLPAWENIPNIGLYMEQVLQLLRDYFNYIPPELVEEELITAAAINNYVRKKIMPEPVKKKYYRIQIAYLLMILSLKQSLSISMIHRLIPMDLSEECYHYLPGMILELSGSEPGHWYVEPLYDDDTGWIPILRNRISVM